MTIAVDLGRKATKQTNQINLRSLLASTTNNNFQGPNMPKYGFEVLIFNAKDMCLFDIICYVAKMQYKRGVGNKTRPYF